MHGRQHLLLEYYASELDEQGIPLVFLTHDMEAKRVPYLLCIRLVLRDESIDLLPTSLDEYLNAVLRDVWEASAQSQEAAHLLFFRLESSAFGPIRCKRVDEPLSSWLLSRHALRSIIPTTPWD